MASGLGGPGGEQERAARLQCAAVEELAKHGVRIEPERGSDVGGRFEQFRQQEAVRQFVEQARQQYHGRGLL
jgi:hypothetical protein